MYTTDRKKGEALLSKDSLLYLLQQYNIQYIKYDNS